MTMLKHLKTIALGLAFTGAGAMAGAAHADEPCAGVDTELTDARQQEYAGLVVEAMAADVQSSDVEIHNFLESGTWSAVYISVPVAEDGMFFFEEADGVKEFRDVWGGWAEPSDRPDLIAWAEDLGAPEDLASCFADVVIGDPSVDQSFGFAVELAFTVDALDSLTERNEEVIVSASYYADPTPEGEQHADDIGRIDLGTEDVQVPAEPGTVEITGDEVDTDALQWTEGDIGVNVNVFTARLSSDDNLINCDIIDGPLADAMLAAPVMLRCALIEEGMDFEVKP